MAFKINIGTKNGKTFKLETEAEKLVGRELKEKIDGKSISNDLEGYEFYISGASDNAGFPALENAEGVGLQRFLLSYGKGLKKRPKGESKEAKKPKGLRYKKSVRGKVISPSISQVNLKLVKQGKKPLEEIFPDQVKKESPESGENSKPEESQEKSGEEQKSEENKKE